MRGTAPGPRALTIATLIDVLPEDRVVQRVDDHLVVRSPGNPGHWEGNLLVFDDAPRVGDGPRWEAAFADAFADQPAIRHRAFYWDRTDGEPGAVDGEFTARGYRRERDVGLLATPAELVAHPRANRAVEIRRLDPDGDAALWEADIALAIEIDAEAPSGDADFATFVRARQRDRRTLFAAGRGAWYVALDPDTGELVASCGVVATGPRGRFQAVSTAPAHRRRGIARRLVADAARDAGQRFGLAQLVIVADADHHARGIYESLGFRPRERVTSVWRAPVG